jgi:hypothetical protein
MGTRWFFRCATLVAEVIHVFFLFELKLKQYNINAYLVWNVSLAGTTSFLA